MEDSVAVQFQSGRIGGAADQSATVVLNSEHRMPAAGVAVATENRTTAELRGKHGQVGGIVLRYQRHACRGRVLEERGRAGHPAVAGGCEEPMAAGGIGADTDIAADIDNTGVAQGGGRREFRDIIGHAAAADSAR